ncbi:hypothetical protein ACF08N_01580 [Streptomyces sp. NPDC015127]|uniref:pPIWI_RE_Y domain-containing protein n=1 Tax=Streptomyces sp. NPDC015127 TaxID=3364939 RepID=UPI0036FFECD9
MPEPSSVPGTLAEPDVRLLRDVATAVVRLDAVTRLASFSLPYPPQAQRALDALVLACLRQGARPPSGVPELLRWCRTRPLGSWPLEGLGAALFDPDDRLIEPRSGTPTQLCHELAVEGGGDSTTRQYDRIVIHEAMRRCRDANSPESYTAFRRVLVSRPVLTRADLFDLQTDLYLDPVMELLELIYVPAPDTYLQGDAYTPCARCRTLLTPIDQGKWWCEHERCRRLGAPPPGTPLDREDSGEVLHLARPLRLYVTGPGHAEAELEDALRGLGLTVEMWPGFDAYDLRVTFPDGHVWALDVKDWAHPGLLGRSAQPVRPEPPYDEACWVVPRVRTDIRRDYLAVYARERKERAGGLRLLTDQQVLRAAAARLYGERGDDSRIAPHSQGGADHA